MKKAQLEARIAFLEGAFMSMKERLARLEGPTLVPEPEQPEYVKAHAMRREQMRRPQWWVDFPDEESAEMFEHAMARKD